MSLKFEVKSLFKATNPMANILIGIIMVVYFNSLPIYRKFNENKSLKVK